ncbi:MAG: hypothetical protein H0T76_06675 [Nannocystis sp.]|nr:Ca2+-dependent phosphoinositide-specific phospholipase C [Nannocystis sp.]MBA3546146.1 hypothetical protein [Nannocystis sp.]
MLLRMLAVSLAAAACSSAPAETADAATGPTSSSATTSAGSATTSAGSAMGEPTGATGGSDTMSGPDELLRVTDVTMRCTHNSYHIEPAMPFDDSHRYTQAPLDVQLGDLGVRAFELDVHSGAGFPVHHIPFGVDDLSTCADLGACLGVIDGWSAANPAHHLLVVWIEIKDELDGVFIEDYAAFDAVIRGALPPERLYEPDEFKRGQATLREALLAEGWPTLGETRGQVMVVLLDVDDPHNRDYTKDYTTLDGRAMFARAGDSQYEMPWAVIAKIDDPTDGPAIAAARAAGLLIASNTGSAGKSDADNAARLQGGIDNGSHMLCDDFPAAVPGQDYVLDLPGGAPSICNPQTAPKACTSAAIESLGG